MSDNAWVAVETYLAQQLLPADPILQAALDDSAAAGLPSIQVAPAEGRLLYLLASALQARRILEIGTLGGYSTIWLARALPAGGKVVTIEISQKHAAVARVNIDRAGLSEKVDLRVGSALDILPQIAAEGGAPFDLSFIDADKENNVGYFDWALKLSRPGSLIVVDNVVRSGAVIDANSKESAIQGVRRFFERVAAEPRVEATAIQTVGSKGYDGMAFLLVRR
jgi:predicted O-methyltransferase YrrM